MKSQFSTVIIKILKIMDLKNFENNQRKGCEL